MLLVSWYAPAAKAEVVYVDEEDLAEDDLEYVEEVYDYNDDSRGAKVFLGVLGGVLRAVSSAYPKEDRQGCMHRQQMEQMEYANCLRACQANTASHTGFCHCSKPHISGCH